MKTKVVGLLILFCVLSTVTCLASLGRTKVKGDGNIVTRTIPVAEYESLSIGSSIMPAGWFNPFKKKRGKSFPVFNYKQTLDTSSLQVTMDENLFSYLKVKVERGRLYIGAKGDDIELHPTRLIMNSNSKNLQRVEVNGSMSFVSEYLLKLSNLDISVSGVGDVRMDDLVCDTLSCDLSGVGHAYLTGKVRKGNYNVSGIGKMHALNCEVKELNCDLSGIGSMTIRVSDYLRAETSGIGKIKYIGNPKLKCSSSGIGSIKRIEE